MMVSFMPIKFDIARMAQQFAICKKKCGIIRPAARVDR